MTSNALDVPAYIKDVPIERRPAVETLRSLCLNNLQDYEESIDYGMPCYKRNGAMEVAFASQKQYIALYIMKKDIVDEFRDSLNASSIGKGCIRFTKPDKIDFGVISKMLRRTVESASAPC